MTNETDLLSFDCGVEEINRMISSQLKNLLNENNKTYIVKYRFSEQYIIGVYTISNRELYMDTEDLNLSPTTDSSTIKINAMELSLLAISKLYRNKGIGTYLVDRVKHITLKEAFHVLYVEAYHNAKYSAVNFYSRNGFDQLSHNYETTSMYFLI